MKLSSISCTLITFTALSCSVVALPNPAGGFGGTARGTKSSSKYARDLEADDLFARNMHGHHPSAEVHDSENGHVAAESVYGRDLEPDNLFVRDPSDGGHSGTGHGHGHGHTSHGSSTGNGYGSSSSHGSLYRRDLEGGRLFARGPDDHGHSNGHVPSQTSESVSRRDLEGARLVARYFGRR